MSANKLIGSNTPRYKAIRSNNTHIILHFEQVLTKLKALCFEKELIASNESADPRQPLYVQSEDLSRSVLKKIGLHQKWYDIFMTVLDNFPELKDIKHSIEKSYALEDGSQFESLPRRSPRLKEISQRQSDCHSKNVHPTDQDSGVSGVTVYSESQIGDAIEEQFSSDDEQARLLNNSEQKEDNVFATSSSVAVSSEGVHLLAGKPMFTSTPAENCTSPVDTRSETTSQLVLQGHDKYPTSKNELEERLRQMVEEQSKTIEDLGGEVSEKDVVIDNLKKELN